jgi:epoxyqueuosine reductase
MIDQGLLTELGILDWAYTEEGEAQSFDQFSSWVEQGDHGSLGYLADYRKDLRRNLLEVYPNFQSALVFLFSYQSAKKWMIQNGRHEIAAYALGFEGEDYHHELKRRLQLIETELKTLSPNLETFISLDAQPILERDLAYRSGLGWFGKNSMLIHQKHGSYFIIGSLLLNEKIPLPIRHRDIDHCGQCNACVEACPTDAIDPESRTLKADKCIATFTIETMKPAPAPEGFENSRGEIFGCDICQDVCPWNNKPLQRIEGKLELKVAFQFIKEWFYEMPKNKLKAMIENESRRGWRKKLKGTALERPGKEGWLKNLR